MPHDGEALQRPRRGPGLRGAVAAILAALVLPPAPAVAQSPWPPMTRVESESAVVYFDDDLLSADEMRAFAGLVDRGIRDVGSFLRLPPVPAGHRIRYYVSRRIRISSTRGGRVFLPAERVLAGRAPYLHETVHVLRPGRNDVAWLNEGLASYVECWVSENLGGYDAQVFSRSGNRGVDREAARMLLTADGQAVLPYVGTPGAPPGMFRDRARVARPFYVLSHSFLKLLVDRLGVETVAALLDAVDVDATLESRSGRRTWAWKQEWLARLQSPGVGAGE